MRIIAYRVPLRGGSLDRLWRCEGTITSPEYSLDGDPDNGGVGSTTTEVRAEFFEQTEDKAKVEFRNDPIYGRLIARGWRLDIKVELAEGEPTIPLGG